jgi:type II secretory pathway component PulM
MPGSDSELAMMGLVLAILILVFLVVWFVFMLPMEKGLHKRRMELLQRRMLQNEERLRREASEKVEVRDNATAEKAHPDNEEERPRKCAGGA